jgi:hypothetical protein
LSFCLGFYILLAAKKTSLFTGWGAKGPAGATAGSFYYLSPIVQCVHYGSVSSTDNLVGVWHRATA